MIVLNLSCANGHAFEGWFASRAAFDDQCRRGLVSCTLCATDDVHALPSGPRVLRHAGTSYAPALAVADNVVQSAPADMAGALFRALALAARSAENVGARFPEEARRIHYDEVPARAIRGIASRDETEALLDEGILVLPAPVPAEGDLH